MLLRKQGIAGPYSFDISSTASRLRLWGIINVNKSCHQYGAECSKVSSRTRVTIGEVNPPFCGGNDKARTLGEEVEGTE